MKKVKFLLSAAMLLWGATAIAQLDLSDPKYAKWGNTPAEREQNMLASSFLKEEIANRNYDEASKLLNRLIVNCPTATENTFVNGATLYKNRINRAKSVEEKNLYIDSLMWLYDKRNEYFGSHPDRGTSYILERKAAEYLAYKPNDRAGIRKVFCEAIEAGGMGANPEIVVAYFANLCADYKNTEEVAPEQVIAEYDRLTPIFTANPDLGEFKSQFDAAFGLSGVASCEVLEALFRKRLEAAPDDVTVLAQAVALLSRAKCDSPFYFSIAERYYAVKPSSETAMFLAQAFQTKGEYAKANKYLNEALAVEKDPKERQQLLVRMAIVGLVGNDIQSAYSAARQARDLNPEDGAPYFVIAQCYAISAAHCPGISGQAGFWAAYDTMAKALELLPSDSEFYQPAKTSLGAYRSRFPSSEECFFNELKEGSRYTIACGMASGVATTVRPK